MLPSLLAGGLRPFVSVSPVKLSNISMNWKLPSELEKTSWICQRWKAAGAGEAERSAAQVAPAHSKTLRHFEARIIAPSANIAPGTRLARQSNYDYRRCFQICLDSLFPHR